MSLAPFSSNLQPPFPAASPAASLLAQGPEARRKAERDQGLPAPDSGPPEAADAAARSGEASGATRGEPARQREEPQEAGGSRSRFARVLEEKMRRFEERDGETQRGGKAGTRGETGDSGPMQRERPEKELLQLLRRAWSAAKAAEKQARSLEPSPRTRTSREKDPRDGKTAKTLPDEAKRGGPGGARGGDIAASLAAWAGRSSAKAGDSGQRGSGEGARKTAAQAGTARGTHGSAAGGLKDAAADARGGGGAAQNGRISRVVVLDLRPRGEQGTGSGNPSNSRTVPGKSALIGGEAKASRAEAARAAAGRGASGKPASEEARRHSSGQDREFATLLKGHASDRSQALDARQASDLPKSAPSLKTFQERFVPEVLRHTGIILKEGGSGEIRLLLRPEGLGSVRIRLALSETSLEGRIVVENSTVKDLMDGSLEHLKQALREGGFQTASLEVAVDSRHDSHPEQGATPVTRVPGAGSRELEQAVPPLLELISAEPSLVNLVV